MTQLAKPGDIVLHLDEAHPSRIAKVIDRYGPENRMWLRVKTPDGKLRIWAEKNIYVLDEETVDSFFDGSPTPITKLIDDEK